MHRSVFVSGGEGEFLQDISIGPHRLQADEPNDSGGDDAGPNPYELLLAALGACTGMTLRMYAERKQWPLQDVQVRLAYLQLHAEDGVECEPRHGMTEQIERKIYLIGDLSEDQRRKLLEIANHCPVHRTLTSAIEIATWLAEPAHGVEARLQADA
ncbi:MAG: OsmC-like protein [Chthonomonadaceae bacterium]|nr:OsmC-like protein [Chthonomonadaceae bacterium]